MLFPLIVVSFYFYNSNTEIFHKLMVGSFSNKFLGIDLDINIACALANV